MNAPFQIPARPPAELAISREPAYNNLTSLALLNAAGQLPDADPWLRETAAALSLQQRRDNRLVFDIFGELLLIPGPAPDLPAYLRQLRACDPAALRDEFLSRLESAGAAPFNRAELLTSQRAWVNLLQPLAEPELLAEAHHLLIDPPALQALAADHLQALWDGWLAAEWRRKSPLLESLQAGLQRREWPAAAASEIIGRFLQRETPPEISALLAGVRKVVIVLSPHIGGHASRFGSPDTIWVFVRGRAEELPLRQAPVKRVELVNPLAALADETRLQILDLLAHHGPLLAQEIIAQLDLSQSSVSRHLKQLRGAGFLSEERGDGANKRYSFNPARIDWVFRSLNAVLSAEPPAPPARPRAEHPPELRHFLDSDGRVVRWPGKRKVQIQVLDYLIQHFEPGRDYSEKEVNALINRWHTFGDHATLRRELYEADLLDRTSNGARYWRPAPDQ
ncbi:MAG TPA: metalloregulator ArsR/SmtB family transcription factor [Herpetosiphonaceae bacterium]